MFSPLTERLRSTLSWRITAWYAAFFVAGFIGLLLVVQWELGRSLRQMDHELLRTKFSQLHDELGDEGLKELRKLCSQKDAGSFLVRVADETNQTLFDSLTAGITSEDLAPLAQSPDGRAGLRFSSLSKDGNHFDVETASVKGGYLLQVGYSAATREGVLRRLEETWASILLPTVAASILLSALLAGRMLQPLRVLNKTLRHIIQTRRLDDRIRYAPASGEIGDLITAFNEMLDRIEHLVSTMRGTLDNVAHDLRTPLTRLRGIAELALNENDPAAAHEALAECVEEAERVTTLLNTFMDISEAENGAMTLHLQPVNVAELVQGIVELYSIVAEEKDQQIIADLPSDLTLYADPNRIHQAVANLVDNAIKYTPAGGRLAISARSEGAEIAIAVQDSGIGIAPDESGRIWDRLYRADKSRSERGLGLGLSFVKAIVQAHKGRVELQSTPGEGSKFTLHLPAAVGIASSEALAVANL
jgi:signal transduction histidine kinase